MEFIRGIHNLRPQHRGCVLTIGAYDGFHCGHQKVLEHLQRSAAGYRLPTVLLTLEPLPREFFAIAQAPPRLMSLRDKICTADQLGIDRMLCIRFNTEISKISAVDFIREIFVDRLAVKHVTVGDDVRFGHAQRGDFDLLKKMGNQYQFTVSQAPTVQLMGSRVSSSRIREALIKSDFGLAQKLLNKSYAISGRVCLGRKFGRTLGFPTANIPIHRQRLAVAGVYVVTVAGIEAQPLPAVANIGTRPTVQDRGKLLMEVHILDFDRDIYGQRLKVSFCHRLRSERRFDSSAELKKNIDRDVRLAREWFQANRVDVGAK